MKRMSALAILGLVLLVPAGARAGVEDRFGLGTRATALAGSVGARQGGFAAVWYNPAGLAPANDPDRDPPGFLELSAGVLWAPALEYVEDLSGSDVSERVAAPTPDTFGFWLGSRFDLGHAIGLEGLSAGVSVYLPGKNLFRWSIRPDEELQWMFLTDRTQHIAIDAGLAYRIAPWLSLGLGLRVLFDVETLTTGRVTTVETVEDPETGETIFEVGAQLGEDVRVVGRLSPTVGLLAEPLERLRVGLTYRARTFVDDYGWTRVEQAPLVGTVGYVHRFIHYYQPHQVTVSAAGEPVPDLSVSLDLTWANWSEGRTVNDERAQGFRDTWTPAAGVSWDAGRGFRLLAGYRFDPAPFVAAGGPVNLLVNDQHVSALGVELHLDRLAGEPTWRYVFRLGGQLHWLVEREERKQVERFPSEEVLLDNPGYPGYRYGGVVPAISFSIQAEW